MSDECIDLSNVGLRCSVDYTYNIYEQLDHPEMDAYTHLPWWITYYEAQIGRPLGPEDYLFPLIEANGIINLTQAMKYEHFLKMLKTFATSAGLKEQYTTHSFCHGGAQYRFMYAPFRCHWTLNCMRWWGGWAVGESVSDCVQKKISETGSPPQCRLTP